MYQPFITKQAPFAIHRLETELCTLEISPSESDKLTVNSCADSEKAKSIKYSKALGETKPPVDVDVTTANPSLNSVLSPAHDAVLNGNAVTAVESALSASASVVLQGYVANLSQSRDALVESQANQLII